MAKSPDAFRTISEVADWLGVPTHVLRFWESRFTQVKPVKRAGGRRYYRPTDMELLGGIKRLLHDDGLTIRGVQKLLREEGVRHVASLAPPLDGRPDQHVSAGDNVVALGRKNSDPEAALDRWPFVEDDAAADSAPATDKVDHQKDVTADASADRGKSEEDLTPEPQDPTPVEPAQSTAPDMSPDDGGKPASEAQTTPPIPKTMDDAPPDGSVTVPDGQPTAPLAQPPLFDESAIYFAGPRVIAGLSRITRRQVRAHADQFEQALDRGQSLKRAMDRLDG